jgi:FkbM family methyltransferase
MNINQVVLDFAKTREVYKMLQDDYSRFIYEKRVMFCLTGDPQYMDGILESIIDKGILSFIVEKMKRVKDKLVIRGVGNDYWILKKLYPELEFVLFVDADETKQGRMIDGKSVISPGEFYEKYKDYYVLVNSAAANNEIIDELRKNGIEDQKIINLADCYEGICDKQYFEDEIVPKESNEVFVDGGCYDGRTLKQFIRWCGGDYKKIFAFEPDNISYERIIDSLELDGVDNVEVFNRGLWSNSTELSFSEDGSQGAKISEFGNITIKTATIDECVGNERVTFIKLDVEGAEYEALLGARNTIIRDRPKLAISIYHKPEDIFQLTELIMSFNNDYKFFLRHYQLSPCETILYCV